MDLGDQWDKIRELMSALMIDFSSLVINGKLDKPAIQDCVKFLQNAIGRERRERNVNSWGILLYFMLNINFMSQVIPNRTYMDCRGALFWGVCIPTRLAIASQADKPVIRATAAVISYRWLSGLEDGHIGAFGGVAWWAKQRELHGLLWAVYAVTGDGRALYADTAFGALNWLSAADKTKRM